MPRIEDTVKSRESWELLDRMDIYPHQAEPDKRPASAQPEDTEPADVAPHRFRAQGLFTSEAAVEGESDTDNAAARRAAARRRRAPASSTIKVGEGKEVKAIWGAAPSDGPDYELFASIKDGEVVSFTRTFATKIRTDVDFQIGDALLAVGNHAKDYPGVYSIWLKKKGSGWVLVVNSEPDVWGTMHNPEADVAEAPLKIAKLEEPVEKFTIELKAEDGVGTIRIAWGDNEWTAPLKIDG